MLKGEFYILIKLDSSEGPDKETQIRAKIQLNPGHRIYAGHFPSNPVVPGVCQVQIISELLREATGISHQLISSDFIKFPAMIDPNQYPDLIVNITTRQGDNSRTPVSATIVHGPVVFIKFKGLFASTR